MKVITLTEAEAEILVWALSMALKATSGASAPAVEETVPRRIRVLTERISQSEIVPDNPHQPGDRDYLHRMAKVLKAQLPDGYGFICLALPFEPKGKVFYTSNLQRVSAVAALKECLRKFEDGNWMKHE